VISGNGPAYVTQLDPLTGRVLKSFQLQSDAYGSTYFYYTGLQVASAAFTLNGTNVPKGSLLVFNGYAYPNDEVLAINPANGSLIARLQLGSNYDLSAGVFDAASGHLFVVARNSGTKVVEINPADGVEINSFATPFGAGQAGLAIDPTTGQLWYGSDNSSKLELLDNTGTSVKEVDLAAQGLATGVSGLAFDAGGNLLVSTTSGEVLVASTA
jgi:DNA-binding beta-propeller fold protein YncE